MDPIIYKKVLENVNDAVFIVQDGKIKYINFKLLEILSYDSENELVGKELAQIIHPDDYAKFLIYQEQISGNEKFEKVHIKVAGKNKISILVEMKIKAFQWNGKPATMNFLVNVSNQIKMQEIFQESSALIHELFLNCRDLIIVLDEKGIFRHCSPSLTAITGYQEHDLIGKNCFEFIHPDYQKVAKNDFLSLVSGKVDGVTTEFRFLKADGSWIYFEALGNNCISNSTIKGIVVNARDATMRKRMEDHLLQAHKLQAIGTLASGIAHDFNNLLMAIQGNISLMLLHKDSNDPDLERLGNIEALVQSGADLATNLLSFARGGQYKLELTDLNELVLKTCEIFGRTKKEIIIRQKYEKNVWPVEVDRGQIEQVLINLYINSWQAMSCIGGDISVETDNVTLSENEALVLDIKEGNYVRIMIADTGKGMDEQTCRRIFEPFFTTKEKDRGTGLALASAYGIIKEHGGTFDVISAVDQGSTFSIFLPASTKQIQKEETNSSKKMIPGNETILLIDDERSIIEVCGEMLKTLGYNILTAGNGRDGIKIYKENKGNIDLVILDMIMPGLSGSETFDSLRSVDQEVRIMLSTGYIISDQVKNLLAKGCRGFIQKPFRMEELSEKVREVLDKK